MDLYYKLSDKGEVGRGVKGEIFDKGEVGRGVKGEIFVRNEMRSIFICIFSSIVSNPTNPFTLSFTLSVILPFTFAKYIAQSTEECLTSVISEGITHF